MTWKIVADSAADIDEGYVPSSGAKFEEVPLSILVNDKEFVDNHDLETGEMLETIYSTKEASTTACPSPEAYRQAFLDADNVIVVVLSKNLSGSFNAAHLARQMVLEQFPDKKIHIIDSHSTCGPEYLIVQKANELIEEGKPFEVVVDELEEYRDSLETLFTLSRYDNLIKNGRLNKLVGKLIKALNIRIVGKETDGMLDVFSKVRGEAKAIKTLVDEMSKLKNMDGANVIIANVNNNAGATAMKHLIEKKYPDVNSVKILKAGGLNSFYAEDQGLIVGF